MGIVPNPSSVVWCEQWGYFADKDPSVPKRDLKYMRCDTTLVICA